MSPPIVASIRSGYARTQPVGRGIVGRVADQDDRAAGHVTRDGLLVLGRHREVQVLAALEHVRARGDEEAAVVRGVTVRDAEHGLRVGRVRRDRRGRRHREAPRHVARRLGDLDHERVVVGSRHPADRVGLARAVVVEPFDHGVVERVSARAGLRVGLALDRADEVLGGDLDVLQRRRVLDARLDRERVRQAVVGDGRQRRGQVRLELAAAVLDRDRLRRQQGAQEAALEVLERQLVVLLLRVERGARRRSSARGSTSRPAWIAAPPVEQTDWSPVCRLSLHAAATMARTATTAAIRTAFLMPHPSLDRRPMVPPGPYSVQPPWDTSGVLAEGCADRLAGACDSLPLTFTRCSDAFPQGPSRRPPAFIRT